jgi:hypothetical protein
VERVRAAADPLYATAYVRFDVQPDAALPFAMFELEREDAPRSAH